MTKSIVETGAFENVQFSNRHPRMPQAAAYACPQPLRMHAFNRCLFMPSTAAYAWVYAQECLTPGEEEHVVELNAMGLPVQIQITDDPPLTSCRAGLQQSIFGLLGSPGERRGGGRRGAWRGAGGGCSKASFRRLVGAYYQAVLVDVRAVAYQPALRGEIYRGRVGGKEGSVEE